MASEQQVATNNMSNPGLTNTYGNWSGNCIDSMVNLVNLTTVALQGAENMLTAAASSSLAGLPALSSSPSSLALSSVTSNLGSSVYSSTSSLGGSSPPLSSSSLSFPTLSSTSLSPSLPYGSSLASAAAASSSSLAPVPSFASALNSTSLDVYDSILYNNCNSTLTMEDAFIGGYSALVLEFTKILYGIVCLVGLCGNTLVIYVVLRFSKMQTVTNMYIFNLALADEMFLIGLPFLIATVKYKSWPFGQLMCQIYMITTSINQFTSSLLLTVMSADRYIAVCHPISSPRYRTPFIAKFICLTVWTVSALLMVPIFMYASVLSHGPRDTLSCNIVFPENEYMNGQRAFTLYSFTLGFFIPFILIFLFYFLVICRLRTVGPKNKSKEKKRSHRKVTYLVLTVITVYVACWLPYWIGQVYITFQKPNVRHSDLCVSILLLAGCLSYANSAVNPILYAFLSDNFKKSFAKAFTCAAGKDVNAALHVENSVFPKTTRGSTKGTPVPGFGTGGGGGGTTGSCIGGGGGSGRGSVEIAHRGSSFGCNLSPCQGINGAYIDHLSGSSLDLHQGLLDVTSANELTSAHATNNANNINSIDINSISHNANNNNDNNKILTTINCSRPQQLIDHDNEAVTLVNLLYRQGSKETNIIIDDEDDDNDAEDDEDEDDILKGDHHHLNNKDDQLDHVELINCNTTNNNNNNSNLNCIQDVQEFISFTPEPCSQGIINYSCCSNSESPIKDSIKSTNNNIITSDQQTMFNSPPKTKVSPLICNGINTSNRSSSMNNSSNNSNLDHHHHRQNQPSTTVATITSTELARL